MVGAVTSKREQHKAGSEDADELANLGRQRGVLGRGERQCERNRAAHSAPQHDELVIAVDRLCDPGEAEHREQPVKRQRARDEGRDDQRGKQAEIAPARLFEKLGGLHRRKQKDQRARPEGQLLPGDDEALPVRRRQPAAAAGADRQRRGGDRDDAGNADIMIADDKNHIGEGDRQRRLGQAARAQYRDEQRDGPAGDIAGGETAAELAHKGDEPVQRAGRPVAGQHRNGERVDRDRRGVVEQALALHQGRQAARRPDVVEDRDHRDRIGGRDDRAEDHAGQDPDRRDRPQGEPDDKGADDDADDGEQQNRADLVAELAHIDIERRLEQQRRQKDIKQRFGAEPEIVQPAHDIADDAARVGGEGEIGDAADRDADHGEQDGVGDREAARRAAATG